VFLKRCDSCTIIFKVRADDASSRPVEEAWNKEVGCNHNKLAYTYIYQRTSRMKWCLMFLLRMTCLAALPCENGNWQFEEASTLMFVFYGYTEKFNRISRNRMFRSYCLYLYLELSLSLSFH
jgi:hypothetical protein